LNIHHTLKLSFVLRGTLALPLRTLLSLSTVGNLATMGPSGLWQLVLTVIVLFAMLIASSINLMLHERLQQQADIKSTAAAFTAEQPSS
jgi:hypothetical protein